MEVASCIVDFVKYDHFSNVSADNAMVFHLRFT